MPLQIEKYNDDFRNQIIEIWEESVRATHHFLQSEDIDFYKSIVQTIDFNTFDVFCGFSENKELVGFLGIAENKLEMLFLKPECIGKGIGKTMMDFALNELKITEVDVNEDNTNALDFYKKFGFKVYDRTPLDGTEKPYPILKMRL
ncbi:GNAT family N-acetyltransferase [Emticicia sp. SJ17W-69]|uniref:GNAT family N-acetyltransferase n=1 Tax=Emticicia sp. SJ17W-69 TaxID=3421657 RepID=UPI003EB74062